MNTTSKPKTSNKSQRSQESVADRQTLIRLERIFTRSAGAKQLFDRQSRHRIISPAHQSLSAAMVEIWDYRELIENLAWRDLTTRYRQTALGISWALIQPLLTMLVATACFGRMMQSPDNGAPYPIFVFSGLLLWHYFSAAVTRGSNSVLGVGGLIKKVYFPRLIAPMAAVIPPLADFLIASVLMIGLMVVYHIPVTANIIFAPLFVMLASTLALGVGFWAAALHVKYRDVFHIIPFFLQLGMFASPIFYSTTAIPKQIQSIYFLNPMYGIIDGFRWSLVGTAPPSINSIEVSVVVSLVFLVSGITYFRLREDEFADYV